MLLRDAYKDILVGLAMDEAHLRENVGGVRISFSKIGELRSIVPS